MAFKLENWHLTDKLKLDKEFINSQPAEAFNVFYDIDIHSMARNGTLITSEEKALKPEKKEAARVYFKFARDEETELKELKDFRINLSAKKALTLKPEQITRIKKVAAYIECGLTSLEQVIDPEHHLYLTEKSLDILSEKDVLWNIFGIVRGNNAPRANAAIYGDDTGHYYPLVSAMNGFHRLFESIYDYLTLPEATRARLNNPTVIDIINQEYFGEDKTQAINEIMELSEIQISRLNNQFIREVVFSTRPFLYPQQLTLEELEKMTDREFATYSDPKAREWAMADTEGRGRGQRFENAHRPKLMDLAKNLTSEQVKLLHNNTLKEYIFTNRMTLEEAATYTPEQIETLQTLVNAIGWDICSPAEAKTLSEEQAETLGSLYEIIANNKITKEEALTLTPSQAKYLNSLSFLMEEPVKYSWNQILDGAVAAENYTDSPILSAASQIGHNAFDNAFRDLCMNKRGFFDKFKTLSYEDLSKLPELAIAANEGIHECDREGWNNLDNSSETPQQIIKRVRAEKTDAAKKALLDLVYPELAKLGAPHSGTGTKHLS